MMKTFYKHIITFAILLLISSTISAQSNTERNDTVKKKQNKVATKNKKAKKAHDTDKAVIQNIKGVREKDQKNTVSAEKNKKKSRVKHDTDKAAIGNLRVDKDGKKRKDGSDGKKKKSSNRASDNKKKKDSTKVHKNQQTRL